MWLTFAILAGLFFTLQGLLTRHILKGDKDAWAFSFYFSLIGTIVSFPFMLSNPKYPTSLLPWLLVIVVGIIIVGHNLLVFKASHFIEPSLSGAITKFKLIWILLMDSIIYGVVFSWELAAGALLTVAAGFVIVKKLKKPARMSGIWMTLGATLINASIVGLFYKLFPHFNAVSLTFFVAFLPATILNFILMPNARNRVVKIYKKDARNVSIACVLGALANLTMISALQRGNASSVLVILESFLIVTLVGEHFILKEKEAAWIKVLAVILAVAGASLIVSSK